MEYIIYLGIAVALILFMILIIYRPNRVIFLYPFFYLVSDPTGHAIIPLFGTIDQLFIVLSASILFIYKATSTNRNLYKKVIDDKLLFIYLMYCFVCLLSIFNNPTSDVSAIYHTVTSLGKIGISFVVYQALISEEDLHFSLSCIIVFMIIIMLFQLYFAYHLNSIFFLRNAAPPGESSLAWTLFYNPNTLSRAIMLIIPMGYIYSMYWEKKIPAIVVQTLCLFCFLVPLLGISRIATLSMVLIMISMCWKFKKRFTLVIFACLVILIISLPQVEKRFGEAYEKGFDTGRRAETAKVSLEIIKDHPLLGTGKRSSVAQLEKYGGPQLWTTEGYQAASEHNYFLSLMIENGIIGLLVFLALLFSYIAFILRYLNLRDNNMLSNLLFAAFIGFLGFTLTTMTGGAFEENIFWYQVGISLGIIKLTKNSKMMPVSKYVTKRKANFYETGISPAGYNYQK